MDLEKLLRELHSELANKMAEELKDPEVKPATLTAIAKFLKDNNIVHVPESKDALDAAAEEYADMKLDDEEDENHLPFPRQA